MKKYNCLLIPIFICLCLCSFTACGVQSLLYPGADISMPDSRYGAEPDQVEIKAADGVALRGWFFNRGQNSSLVVYYGGNAMNVGAFVEMAQSDTTRSYLLINYRGYGNSEGEPAEAALVQDACHCLHVARKKSAIPPLLRWWGSASAAVSPPKWPHLKTPMPSSLFAPSTALPRSHAILFPSYPGCSRSILGNRLPMPRKSLALSPFCAHLTTLLYPATVPMPSYTPLPTPRPPSMSSLAIITISSWLRGSSKP